MPSPKRYPEIEKEVAEFQAGTRWLWVPTTPEGVRRRVSSAYAVNVPLSPELMNGDTDTKRWINPWIHLPKPRMLHRLETWEDPDEIRYKIRWNISLRRLYVQGIDGEIDKIEVTAEGEW